MEPITESETVEKYRALFSQVANSENWKLETTAFNTFDKAEAEEVRDAIVFFVGGAEIHSSTVFAAPHPDALVKLPYTVYTVVSKGYYFYVGA